MFNFPTGIKNDPPRACHPWIAFRGTIKEERIDLPLLKPALKLFARNSNLPRLQSSVLGLSVGDDIGLKGALFSKEGFAPGEVRLWDGFLDRKVNVASGKFLYHHPYGFGRNFG